MFARQRTLSNRARLLVLRLPARARRNNAAEPPRRQVHFFQNRFDRRADTYFPFRRRTRIFFYRRIPTQKLPRSVVQQTKTRTFATAVRTMNQQIARRKT